MNHSIHPNSQIIYPASKDYRELKSVTTKPILKGEEIFESYSNYYSAKSEWVAAIMHKHYPNRIDFEGTIHEQLSNHQES